MSINLLPNDYGPNPTAVKLVSKLKRVAIVLFALVIVVVGASFGTYVFLGSQLQDTAQKQKHLTVAIESLESTEQQIILLKDRAEKARQVLGVRNAHDQVNVIQELINILPPGAQIDETVLFTDKTQVIIELQSASDVSNLLSIVTTSGTYSQVELGSLAYLEDFGYKLTFVLTR